MPPRWADVDKLVHELGSLRAVIEEVEAQPDMTDDPVVLELRTMLARAADTIHLVIGGNDAMVSSAWGCIAEAQAAGKRAREAVERANLMRRDATALRARTRDLQDTQRAVREAADANIAEAEQRIAALKQSRKAREAAPPPRRGILGRS